MKNLAVLAALPLAMVACSGGGSGSGAGGIAGVVTPGSSINSQFIDAPVKGLKFAKGSGPGQTGDNGAFTCKAGEEVTFEVKGKVIGKANCGEKIYIYDLDGTVDEKDAAAMLIQSLAKTAGDILDLTFFNESTATVDSNLTLDPDTIQGTLNTFLQTNNLDSELTTVTKAAAQAHVLQNLPDQGNDEVLAEFAAGPEMEVRLEPLATNSEDHCWENIRVKVKLESIDMGSGKKAYRFNVNEYLAWDGSETVPSYNASTQCDGKEYGTAGNYFQCLKTPVSKIMSGRSVSGSKYESHKIEIGQGDTAICQHSEGFEFTYNNNAVICPDNTDELEAANDLNLEISLGWSFGISLTDTSRSVLFTESAVDVGAVLADDKVTSYTVNNFSCNYAFVEIDDEIPSDGDEDEDEEEKK